MIELIIQYVLWKAGAMTKFEIFVEVEEQMEGLIWEDFCEAFDNVLSDCRIIRQGGSVV